VVISPVFKTLTYIVVVEGIPEAHVGSGGSGRHYRPDDLPSRRGKNESTTISGNTIVHGRRNGNPPIRFAAGSALHGAR
jgi:hypothetical protein